MSVARDIRIDHRSVRRIGFGAMRLSTDRGDREHSFFVARRALEVVDLIDTAFMYGWGANEELLAEALSPYPARLLLATKIGILQPRPGEWAVSGQPHVLRKQTEDALVRLKVDTIDLLQLHRLDPKIPIADQLGVLDELKRQGKARSIGLSEISVDDLLEALQTAEVATVQNRYSVFDRRAEPLLTECEARGIAFLPWQPISANGSASMVSIVDQIARGRQATRAQVCLAWLLHRSPAIAPIPGTSNIEHLVENVAASDIALTDDELELLSTAS